MAPEHQHPPTNITVPRSRSSPRTTQQLPGAAARLSASNNGGSVSFGDVASVSAKAASTSDVSTLTHSNEQRTFSVAPVPESEQEKHCYDSGNDDDKFDDMPDDDSQSDASEFKDLADNCEKFFGETILQAVEEEEKGLGKHKLILKQGIDPDVKIPQEPEGYVTPPPNTRYAEIPFELVDNPGNWSSYCFRPKFTGIASNGTRKYSYHRITSSGCRVCPQNANGERMENGWTFYYGPWKATNPIYRSGATVENLFLNK